jgi:hypothetical protein
VTFLIRVVYVSVYTFGQKLAPVGVRPQAQGVSKVKDATIPEVEATS